MIPKEKFENAKHTVLIVEEENFPLGSALYSYVLTLHKKVSFVANKKIKKKFAFLPWYDKLRESVPSSCDLRYEVGTSTLELFEFFQQNGIKINAKMATALYASLLIEYNFFRSAACDGIIFALASELIALQAEYKLCRNYLQYRVPLSQIRLKGLLFQKVILTNNAKHAELFVTNEELSACGASFEDCYEVLEDILMIVHVTKVILRDDNKNKIVKEV